MPSNELIKFRYQARMNAESEEAEILLYGEICEDWWSVMSEHKFADKSAIDFDKALKDIKDAKKVTLRINSPGGYCVEAVAMRTMLINAMFEDLTISIEGLCASAATILACIPGAKVTMSEGSKYMIHNPSGGAYGTAAAHEKAAELLHADEASFRGIYAKKCKKSDEDIKKWMDAETWFSAQEAMEAGFVDEISSGEMPMVACVSPRMMTAMRAMYAHIPETISEAKETAKTQDSNENPTISTGDSAGINNKEDQPNMEITDITRDQLRTGNPALYADVMRAGAEAERLRISEIDDMTPAGYEVLAADAKTNGLSSTDYLKAVVKAQREKSAQYLADRKDETANAKEILGGASEDTNHNENDDKKKDAQEIADYAKSVRMNADGGMF